MSLNLKAVFAFLGFVRSLDPREKCIARVLGFRLLFVLVLSSGVIAQSSSDYVDRVGLPNFAVVQPVEMGFINVANGNLHLEFPMTNIPQRGGKSMAVKLTYDSQLYGAGSSPFITSYY